MNIEGPLPRIAAEAIYDVLVQEIGASERWRQNFVHVESTERCSEYRVRGDLGFGGKFWRNRGYRPDGTWGEQWYVNCYREDETAELLAAIKQANLRLEGLRAQWSA